MENGIIVLQVVCALVIAFITFIAPLFAILLSMYSDGIEQLKVKYKEESDKLGKNLSEQLSKLQSKPENIKDIEKTIKGIKHLRFKTKLKEIILSPKCMLVSLLSLLLVSFLLLILNIIYYKQYPAWFIFIDLIPILLSLVVIFIITSLLEEVFKLISHTKIDSEREFREPILRFINTANHKAILKDVDIGFYPDNSKGKVIKSNIKEKIQLAVRNDEDYMASNVEVGVELPKSLVIEKGDYGLTVTEDSQILRRYYDTIQAGTRMRMLPIEVTALEIKDYKIEAWIKAENIETKIISLTLKVI